MTPESVSYSDLAEGAVPRETLQKAFGEGGIGLILVTGVPGYPKARRELLHRIREFALLPESVKERFEQPQVQYQFGWSHGKEFLQTGEADTRKGSYYASPCKKSNSRNRSLDPANNIWPTNCVPGLEPAFYKLSSVMTDAALKLAANCDEQMNDNGQNRGGLSRVIGTSGSHKGRMLYYFPTSGPQDRDSEGQWCGWHCDHSTLTCLTKAIYFGESGEEAAYANRDDLIVRTRRDQVVNVSIPEDALAIQIGQAAQIDTDGRLLATPHAVKPPETAKVARATFALFLQPDPEYTLGSGRTTKPSLMPPQYKPRMTFGQFSDATISMVYSDNRNASTVSKL